MRTRDPPAAGPGRHKDGKCLFVRNWFFTSPDRCSPVPKGRDCRLLQAPPAGDELVEGTYEAFLSVPVTNRGRAIGVINIHHRKRHEHSGEEISTDRQEPARSRNRT